MADGFAHGTGPEGHYRNPATGLVFVVVLHGLHGVRAESLAFSSITSSLPHASLDPWKDHME